MQPLSSRTTDPASDALASIEPLIRSIVARRLRGRLKQHREDVMQDVKLHVYSKVWPAFNPALGVKFSTFAYVAVQRVVSDQVRRLRSDQCRGRKLNSTDDDEIAVCDTGGADNIISELLTSPLEHLSRIKAGLLAVALSTSNRTELAAALGVDADVCSRRMNRLVNDIRALV